MLRLRWLDPKRFFVLFSFINSTHTHTHTHIYIYISDIYTVSQKKLYAQSFAHNFGNCKSILKILTQVESGENFLQDIVK